MSEFSLVERIVCAAAMVWKDDGEALATGIGVVPRLAASLCMASINTDLMMTDAEAWLVREPVPIGPRGEMRAKWDPDGVFCSYLIDPTATLNRRSEGTERIQ